MNVENEAAQVDNGCFSKFVNPCTNLIGYLKCGYPIHPLEPIAPKHSEFLSVRRYRKLRILHLEPNTLASFWDRNISNNVDKRRSGNRNSLSEEYWFTRWNKPLKSGNCNCSFRRSQRFSLLTDQGLPLSLQQTNSNISDAAASNISDRIRTLSSYDIPPIKIINVETLVERLIQETLFEAFQEYFMKQSTSNTNFSKEGSDNLGFVQDEVDGVVLRKSTSKYVKNKLSLHHENTVSASDLRDSLTKEQCNTAENQQAPKKIDCKHNKGSHIKLKPLVLLLHGIGSSADVWWSIINTLTYKGYEVVAPDMLGHGFSSVPDRAGAYQFKHLLKHALAVFDHYVGCDESRKSIVIGHSFGCSLATALCRYRSQQIVQLILISGGGPTPLAPPAQEKDVSVLSCLQTAIKPLLFCGVKRSVFYSSRGKHFEACGSDNAIPGHVLRYVIEGQHWVEGDAAFHRRILIPTLLVHGLQDTKVTLVQECEMERTIPRAFLEIISNAGHMSMLETPEHLSHMIMCFIDWWSR